MDHKPTRHQLLHSGCFLKPMCCIISLDLLFLCRGPFLFGRLRRRVGRCLSYTPERKAKKKSINQKNKRRASKSPTSAFVDAVRFNTPFSARRRAMMSPPGATDNTSRGLHGAAGQCALHAFKWYCGWETFLSSGSQDLLPSSLYAFFPIQFSFGTNLLERFRRSECRLRLCQRHA